MSGRKRPLDGRICYIPRIINRSSRLLAAALEAAFGGTFRIVPESDEHTTLLAAPHLNGDECYPQVLTLGDFLKVLESPDFDPARTAFFLPTSSGPCRFGQYGELLKQVLAERGVGNMQVLSPGFDDGYLGMGWKGLRYVWWSIILSDLLERLLLHTRPYEVHPGQSDALYEESLDVLCALFTDPALDGRGLLRALRRTLAASGERFGAIPVDRLRPRPLIGVVGEIFCRLNSFSNDQAVRRIEAAGGEAWMTGFSEWLLYAAAWDRIERREAGRAFSPGAWRSALLEALLRRDEHRLSRALGELLAARPEPGRVTELLELARPYLPPQAGLGETVLSLGRAAYLQRAGADGILDISPFGCMNGIVSQAIYPALSRDYGGIPIRTLYYDGSGGGRDEEIALFLELAAAYRRKKGKKD